MMFPNNNRKVIAKLTNRSLRANRTRNRFVILAIILTTLLITSVFSIGMSTLKSLEHQQLKIMGTLAHSAVTFPTDEQIKQLERLDYVKEIGLGASAGQVVNSPEMGNISVGLYWYNDNEWTKMRAPLLDSINGAYPETASEIMASTWILKAMGIEQPEVRMELPLTYYTDENNAGTDERTEKFVLSGFYTESMNIRSGNIGAILVAAPFAALNGGEPARSGVANVIFTDGKNVTVLAERLEREIGLGSDQKVKVVPLYEEDPVADRATLIGFAGMILLFALSGYLLIYNVLYISVSRDTRVYGLLKTIGTSARQIRSIVIGQALRMSLIGIPIGVLLGILLSFIIVPMTLRAVLTDTEAQISFSPVIFIGAALFALLTTLVSCVKPARVAGSVSPIEAVRFTGAAMNTKTSRTGYGSRIGRMAWRNIIRDKKRAVIVFLSLFLGLTTFMTINTLVLSMDTDHFVSSYWENEFDLYNNTMSLGYNGDTKEKITEEVVRQIEQIEGVTEVRITYSTHADVRYDPDVFGKHIDAFTRRVKWERPSDELLRQDGMFTSRISGIDFKYVEELNKTLEKPIDPERFERGEVVLLGGDADDFNVGDTFSFEAFPDTSFEIGAFVSMMFQAPGATIAPNIYMSQETIGQLFEDPMVYKLNIKADEEKQQHILEQFKRLFGQDREFYYESRIEQAESMRSTKIALYILGGGIAFILALIGILNFVNTMYTSVQVRKLEFAVMESIGMTRKQLRKLLLLEGMGYAAISILLISTLGSLISYAMFRLFLMEATYAIFTFPTLPLLISVLLVIAVCTTVPLVVYNKANQYSIVERLREAD